MHMRLNGWIRWKDSLTKGPNVQILTIGHIHVCIYYCSVEQAYLFICAKVSMLNNRNVIVSNCLPRQSV